jgi:hypothetical protein
MKYRIKEDVFDDGRHEFYPQFLGKIHQQKRDYNDICSFELVDGWITITNNGLPKGCYDDAKLEIEFHKIKTKKETAKLVDEKIHFI